MAVKRMTFNIDESLKYQVQKLALDKNTTTTDLVTKWIKEALEKENGQTTLDD